MFIFKWYVKLRREEIYIFINNLKDHALWNNIKWFVYFYYF